MPERWMLQDKSAADVYISVSSVIIIERRNVMLKKILLAVLLLVVAAFTFFFFKNVFFPVILEEPVAIMQDTAVTKPEPKEETVPDDETETDVLPQGNGIELAVDDSVKQGQIYKMLDFDRRLILKTGQQDEYLCSIFCLAYARGILDGKMADPYDYYDGDGAVWHWADFEDIALSDPLPKVLQKAYDEIDAGRPVILFCSGNYAHIPGHEDYSRSTGDHYVLLIGFKEEADYKNLKASDFYAADPSRGYSDSKDTFMPWIVLTDEAPATIRGEYALYASMDKRKAVPTCNAFADRSTWDNDLKKEIHPEYLEENR